MKEVQIHPSVQLAWALANREAQLSGSSRIEPQHFLVAILLIIDDCFMQDAEAMGLPRNVLDEIASISAEACNTIGLPEDRITAMRRELSNLLHQVGNIPQPTILHRSEDSRALFQNAARLAVESGHGTLNMLHLLQALLDHVPTGGEVPAGERVSALVRELRGNLKPMASIPRQTRLGANKTPFLDERGRDLIALARKGRLPAVIGRKREMTALARYLQRTTRRNVLIIGGAESARQR